MSLFGCKCKTEPHSVCRECKVHFEPHWDKKYEDLCSVHRKPVEERDKKIAKVVEWATDNWETLLPKAEKALAKKRMEQVKACGAYFQLQVTTSAMSMNQQSGYMGTTLNSLFRP